MEKIKLQAIIMGALILIGVAMWTYPILKKLSAPKPEIGEYVIEEEAVDFFKHQKQLEEKRPKSAWSRDPFQLQPGETVTEFRVEGLKLSGIATDEKGKLAIINNEIVREGDTMLGVKITEITEDRVTVEKEGKEYILKIY